MPGAKPPLKEPRDATTTFFEDLATRDHEPLLHDGDGTLRIDLLEDEQTERYFVTIEKGDLAVSRRGANPDATVKAGRDLFNKMVQGKANAQAALLRGTLLIDGDLGIMMCFSRLFPGPPSSRRAFLERQKAADL